ncbi:uncharacterized protein TRIREDRAFT_65214 [Trichoderma reesei QM6a]|uniref:Predicted protein n=2 Tax=Hypocrea jecorina TaxID=51453 RepID=G0RPE9_HYPJQ|nr:uncharacterized protein TRIREDRAFT_65214 [Trichoderma reesei QM6a]EGR46995.1 predicted protein [Trichoderma reesei QM6a]ETR99707.1 S-adenosyl-L-methionine-dependent methyltransferase [Trichoderma reesei RUT C-30]
MTARKEYRELATREYWDKYYAAAKKSNEKGHEWFRTYEQLKPFFARNLFNREGLQVKDNPMILHPGSGESDIPLWLAKEGYKRQLCFDFSKDIVETMNEVISKMKDANEIENIEYREMDAFNMEGIPDKSIDVAFDKGMMDSLIDGDPWNPGPEVRRDTRNYQKELHRVLKDDGVFLYITFRQPHFVEPLLIPNDSEILWDLHKEVLIDNAASLGYFAWVIRKKGAPVRPLVEAPSETKSDDQDS